MCCDCVPTAFFRSHLAVRPRFCSLGRPPGRPGRRFPRPKRLFFRRFSRKGAAHSKIACTGGRHCKNCSFRDIGRSKNRCEHAFDGARCTTSAPMAHWEGLGASPGRPEDPFGRLLAALGPPGASKDRPWGGIWASISRPERVRTCPRNALRRLKRPKIDCSSILT